MYGYVKAYVPELKVREQEYYRAVYCGLCRSMGKCTGQCSRMTLSYDVTCLALLRLILEKRDVAVNKRSCLLHPMKKKPMAEPDDTLYFCAAVSALLAYHKMKDDRQDEQGKAYRKAVFSTPLFSSMRKKAIKRGYAELDYHIFKGLSVLHDMEADRTPSVDRPAELFGSVMADILSYGLSGDMARVARELGRRLGRWIYLVDAIDDYEEDKARGRYNPFDCLWQGGELTKQRREDLSHVLMNELVAFEAALDLCEEADTEHSNLWGCVRNILYLGMPAVGKRVLYHEGEDCGPQRNNQKKGDTTI